MKKYYNDGFIGNENITATLSKYGELLRLYYPLPDYRQYLDFFKVGIKINDSNLIYLHDDVNNNYEQYYTEGTNVLNTEILNTYFKVSVKQTDFTMIGNDTIIRRIAVNNCNDIDLNFKLLVHSKMMSSFNNMAGGMIMNNALVQYSHNFICATFAKQKIDSYQINDVKDTIDTGLIYGKDYIGMSSDSAISYDMGTIKPGETKTLDLFIHMRYKNEDLNEIDNVIMSLKTLDVDKELENVEKYWRRVLEEHDTLKLKPDGTEFMNKLINIYNRTILFVPLLINEDTGGIAATLEVDEERDECGRYSYCWIRDQVLMYMFLEHLNFGEYSRLFYDKFCKITQQNTGYWEQRYYSDGRLAPCWGYQIDETALVVFGIYDKFNTMYRNKRQKDITLFTNNLDMLEKAMLFIEKYVGHLLNKGEDFINDLNTQFFKKYNYVDEDKVYQKDSYDLWEEVRGVHLFSLSAIYGAYDSMIKIYDEIGETIPYERKEEVKKLKQRYSEAKDEIKNYILNNLVDKKRNVLIRNNIDGKVDISILGAITPFKVFNLEDQIVKNTVDLINLSIRTYNGGYLRYQWDNYMGGMYPWVIATCWMGLYYQMIGDKVEAGNCLRFVADSSTSLGLLPEQVSSDFCERWVIGLGWSHAMFIGMLLNL